MTMLQSAWDVISRLFKNDTLAAALANLPASERERLLHDLGISESDIQRLSAGYSGPEELLPQRLQQVGIDPTALRDRLGAVMRDMDRVCSLCGEKGRCKDDLAHHGDRVRAYCPNTDTIDALVAAKH